MKMPGSNTWPEVILRYMSRDIWIDVTLLYDLLIQAHGISSRSMLATYMDGMHKDGLLERQNNGAGRDNPIQYRLSLEAHEARVPIRRGRVMGKRPHTRCVWFMPPNQRYRRVV